jgi:hypothetical protein
MDNGFEIPNRRQLDRLRVDYPASYVQTHQPYVRRTARLTNLSMAGVKLVSSSRVETGELLDVTLELADREVSFKGRAVHVGPAKGEGFELGISIEEIDDRERGTLIRFLSWIPSQLGRSP